MSKNQEWARYLEKDGEVRLFGSDQLEDARKDGWKEPTGVRGNGEKWNTELEPEDGEPAAESAARLQAEADKRTEAKSARLAKEQAAQAKEREANAIDLDKQPDMRVEVVEKPKSATRKTTK